MKRTVVLPKTIQVWMCYTNSGQMRQAMFTQGGYSDTYRNWIISWDSVGKQYRARELHLNTWRLWSTRKADLYKTINQIARGIQP